MAKFQMSELIPTTAQTARIGAGSGKANRIDDKEVGKIVKMVGDSRYDLAATGDPIEGFLQAVEAASMDDFSIGSVVSEHGMRKEVTFEEDVAVGDYVVAGTPVARGTALTVPVAVKKTTTPMTSQFAWRVVSLGSVGTGAAGTTGVIERVS
jgi:hypothetical protein